MHLSNFILLNLHINFSLKIQFDIKTKSKKQNIVP
jgi:hypothetical protein